MSAFEQLSNDALRSMMNLHFGIIVGATQPIVKPKAPNKKPEKEIPFSEFSFINVVAFMGCFRVASARGILSPAEIAAGNAIMEVVEA